jgi:hypothetical protein
LVQRVWALIRRHLWVKALSSPIPRDEYSLVTGDAFHLTPSPPRTFWNVLHTSTVSRIYIERCNLAYGRGEANLIKQSADVFGAVKSDIKEAIRASWSKTKAQTSQQGLENFEKLWQEPFPDGHFYTLNVNSYVDPTTAEAGPYHGHRSLIISNF